MPLFSVRKITQLALLTCIGLILYVFETYIPQPLPWAKLGLSQMAALMSLYVFGWREALIVTVARGVLGALLLGSFAGPAFWLSIGAGLTSVAIMSVVHITWDKQVSIVGVSLCGAMTHNLTQLLLAYWLIVHTRTIFYLLPLIMLPAIFAGIVVGVSSYFLLQRTNVKFIFRLL